MMIYFGERPLGRNMKALRRKRRLSLKKLSELTGIPYLTLYCLENGTLQDISHDHLLRLCQTLRTTQQTLI